MRPVRSIWSFFRSAQVTCSVHGARAAADLMRGSMSTVCALFEFIPLLQQPLTICQYPRQCFTGVARRDCSGKYFGIGDADLGLKVGSYLLSCVDNTSTLQVQCANTTLRRGEACLA